MGQKPAVTLARRASLLYPGRTTVRPAGITAVVCIHPCCELTNQSGRTVPEFVNATGRVRPEVAPAQIKPEHGAISARYLAVERVAPAAVVGQPVVIVKVNRHCCPVAHLCEPVALVNQAVTVPVSVDDVGSDFGDHKARHWRWRCGRRVCRRRRCASWGPCGRCCKCRGCRSGRRGRGCRHKRWRVGWRCGWRWRRARIKP